MNPGMQNLTTNPNQFDRETFWFTHVSIVDKHILECH